MAIGDPAILAVASLDLERAANVGSCMNEGLATACIGDLCVYDLSGG